MCSLPRAPSSLLFSPHVTETKNPQALQAKLYGWHMLQHTCLQAEGAARQCEGSDVDGGVHRDARPA